MNDKAENVYGDAYFELCCEQGEGGLSDYLTELRTLSDIFDENPGFIKVMGTPTVSVEEKVGLCRDITENGKLSSLCGNLLCVLAEKNRMGCFSDIVKRFNELYNDKFKLAEITVTASEPLSDKMKEQIAAKMSTIIGKTVTIREKVDKSIIGGIVIDYGTRRYDGSVRARLDALKKELGSVIA